MTYIPENDYHSRDFKPFKNFDEDVCTRCERYYKMLFDKKITETPFPPDCEKHIENKILALQPSDFKTVEEFNDASIVLDPIAWAKAEFDWEPRVYQKDFLNCTSQYKVLRWGRQSGKSAAMGVSMLHFAATTANENILVIAPYERQVTNIFDEMEKLLNKSSTVGKSLKRYTKNPSRMEFFNGTKILGFSSGSNSTSGSDKIRGQTSAYLVFDEMDLIAEADIDAVLAVISSRPDAKIVAASTPFGWRKKFFKIVTDKEMKFKEFWFISEESPVWGPKQEAFFGGMYDDNMYEQEIHADFADIQDGVFKSKHIAASIQDYSIEETGPEPNSEYTLGIDWNKSAGTHMCILQWKDSKLKLVRKIIVPESEYTQSDSVQLIISLNRIWQFKYIFLDVGYGHLQYELLRKHALVEPSSMLDVKTFPIHMNQSIEVIDPISGEPVKRQAKHFLVMQTTKLLEDGYLVLPKVEDTTVIGDAPMGLIQQMRNFKIENYSIYGQPKYSQGQDHTLTAYFLACGGFYWKEGDLKGVPYSRTIGGIEVSEDVNKTLPPAVIEREQDARAGWKLVRTTNNKQAERPLSSRELPSGPGRGGLGGLRKDIHNRRNSSISRTNGEFRRRKF